MNMPGNILKTVSVLLLIIVSGCRGGFDGSALTYSSNPAERVEALHRLAEENGDLFFVCLGAFLHDEDLKVRRAAAEMLVDRGLPAKDMLRESLYNSAPAVRRVALLGLETLGEVTVDDLAVAIKDSNEVLRWEATRLLLEREMTDQVQELLSAAQNDPRRTISDMARRSLWVSRFGVERQTLREQFPYRAIDVVDEYTLPAEDWKFRRDPESFGHDRRWFAEDYDDSEWDTIGIEKAWQQFGYEYIGVAWYRTEFELPEQVDCDGAEIRFEGVDESAWVWINGEYVGSHDIGPSGWNLPFDLDIPHDLINWGAKNRIAVRVMNTAHAGGIWRPVTVHFLKVR